MKLNEQQLAQLFRQNKAQSIDTDVDSLLNSTNASNKRINDVEQIANNSQLSATYQVTNQLQDWSDNISKDINSQLSSTNVFAFVFGWLKPTLATAAIAVGIYFVLPNLNQTTDSLQAKPDQMMFSGSFEKSNQQASPTQSKAKLDVIYKGDFG